MNDDARATEAAIRRQIELLKRQQRSDPMETGHDEAIAELEQQLREGEYI